ncbi:MAG: ATP-binding protein [Lentisphaerae bacterium]|nr:ATP-binding protein [Lentisphaerota bacterium]
MNGLKQAHGNWVTGDRFWNRDEEMAQFERHIREGAHLLLVAQRRMGKTSLMKQAAKRLADEFHCIFVDFQNSSSPQDAISELALSLRPHMSIWQKASGAFANIIDKIDKVGIDDLSVTLRAGLSEGNWQTKGDELLHILASQEKPVLLLMDEVPILVNRILKGGDYEITPGRCQTAAAFMTWLRKNSLEHQGQVRMVVSGSIGLEPVLRQAQLSATVNNFVALDLKPWRPETAAGCFRALASGAGMTYLSGAEDRMVELLGCCIPHHVQMFFDHALTYCIRHKCMALAPSLAEEIYKTEMLSSRGHAELTHYEERLKMVLGTEKMGLAVEMLTEAAVTGQLTAETIRRLQPDFIFQGETTQEVQKEILWMLEHDGYLEQTEAGYVFVSKLLREWWCGRHKMFFTPIMEREV